MILDFVRRHIGTIAVALVAATVTAAAPAVGHGVQHALFAHNADKVDGKHAVAATTTINERKGRLVATDPTTGRLPNDIIAKAPDANRLDGHDSRAFTQARHGRRLLGSFPEPNFVFGFTADEPAPPEPWVGVYYICPNDPNNTDGTLRLTYHGSSAVNVWSDNGGAGPSDPVFLTQFARSYDMPTTRSGDHITLLVQGSDGMATIEVFTLQVNNNCDVFGQAVFSYGPT